MAKAPLRGADAKPEEPKDEAPTVSVPAPETDNVAATHPFREPSEQTLGGSLVVKTH